MKSNKRRQKWGGGNDYPSRKELSDEELHEALAEALQKAQFLLNNKSETGRPEKLPVENQVDSESDLIH